MQKMFDADHPEAGIKILGINAFGYGNNKAVIAISDLPWLQDTKEADWWGTWEVTYRDVVILDRQGAAADVFNLTQHNLQDDDDYESLKALLLDAADR